MTYVMKECAPTDIDSASDTILDISSVDDEEVTPLAYWCGRIGRLKEIVEITAADSRILWELVGPEADQHARAVSVVEARLALGFVRGFKIGITHLPYKRFDRVDYNLFTEFMVLCVHDDPAVIAGLEVSVLTVFRRYDLRGQLVNADGHVLCENRHSGGQGAYHGVAPFCLYLALRHSRRP